MPATAVGKANGTSTMASMIRRPGNSYRVSAQTTISPNTRFTAAARIDNPNDSSSACRTRGLVTMRRNRSSVSSVARRNSAASGMSTISDSQSSVVPIVIPNPGITRSGRKKVAPLNLAALASPAVDRVERAAVAEMLLLRLAPAAECVIDREQIQSRKLRSESFGGRGIARTVEVPGRDLLALHGIEELEIVLGGAAGSLAVDDLVHDRDRRLRQNRHGRHDDLEFVLAEFGHREKRLVFPGDQHVADVALDEGHGRAAGAGVQHRHVPVDAGNEVARLLLRSVFSLRKAPGRKIVPTGTARRFRIGRDHLQSGPRQIVPILDTFRIALAHQEHDGRGVGRGVLRQPPLPVLGDDPAMAISSMS